MKIFDVRYISILYFDILKEYFFLFKKEDEDEEAHIFT